MKHGRNGKMNFMAGMLTMALMVGLAGTAAATVARRTLEVDYADVRIELDGRQLTPKDATGAEVEPFICDGTTYLPVRAVSGALGLGVDWDQATHTVKLTSPSRPQAPEGYSIDECYGDFSVPSLDNIVGFDALVDVYALSTGDSVCYTYDPLKFQVEEGRNFAGEYRALLEVYGFTYVPTEDGTMTFENEISGITVCQYWDEATDYFCVLLMALPEGGEGSDLGDYVRLMGLYKALDEGFSYMHENFTKLSTGSYKAAGGAVLQEGPYAGMTLYQAVSRKAEENLSFAETFYGSCEAYGLLADEDITLMAEYRRLTSALVNAYDSLDRNPSEQAVSNITTFALQNSADAMRYQTKANSDFWWIYANAGA